MALKKLAFSALLAVAGLAMANAAMAGEFDQFDEHCGASPYGPDIAIDPQISDDKVKEIRNDVTLFMKASDTYQACIAKVLEIGPKLDKKDAPEKHAAILKRFERKGVDLIDGNQVEKERIGEQFNKLIDARIAAKKTPAN